MIATNKIKAERTGKVYELYYKSQIGIIEIKANCSSILSILFVEKIGVDSKEELPAIIKNCYKQLDEYFTGNRKKFDLKLHITGTLFEKKVINELTSIHYGENVSYKQIAKDIENENAVRAVGKAISKNKFAIVVPCHRVIASTGSLSGYAWEQWRKEWLINFEKLQLKKEEDI